MEKLFKEKYALNAMMMNFLSAAALLGLGLAGRKGQSDSNDASREKDEKDKDTNSTNTDSSATACSAFDQHRERPDPDRGQERRSPHTESSRKDGHVVYR